MSDYSTSFIAIAGFSVAGLCLLTLQNYFNSSHSSGDDSKKYSIADQPLRFANDKKANNVRVMNIDALYNPSFLRGKCVLVTGTF